MNKFLLLSDEERQKYFKICRRIKSQIELVKSSDIDELKAYLSNSLSESDAFDEKVEILMMQLNDPDFIKIYISRFYPKQKARLIMLKLADPKIITDFVKRFWGSQSDFMPPIEEIKILVDRPESEIFKLILKTEKLCSIELDKELLAANDRERLYYRFCCLNSFKAVADLFFPENRKWLENYIQHGNKIPPEFQEKIIDDLELLDLYDENACEFEPQNYVKILDKGFYYNLMKKKLPDRELAIAAIRTRDEVLIYDILRRFDLSEYVIDFIKEGPVKNTLLVLKKIPEFDAATIAALIESNELAYAKLLFQRRQAPLSYIQSLLHEKNFVFLEALFYDYGSFPAELEAEIINLRNEKLMISYYKHKMLHAENERLFCKLYKSSIRHDYERYRTFHDHRLSVNWHWWEHLGELFK